MSLTKIGSIGINTGIQLAGVTTIATLNASDNVLSVGGTVNFVSDVSIGGSVSIGGTLTYEDVTNIDSVGLITARNGIVVGSGITLSKDGDIFATGITTVSGLTISDSIVHDGDTDTKIRFSAADTVAVETAGSQRLTIGSDGNVNIITGELVIPDVIRHREDANTKIRFPEADHISFEVGATGEAMRIDNGGKLLIGLTTRRLFAVGHTSKFQLEGLSSSTSSSLSIVNNQASAGSPNIRLGKTRGTSIGSNTSVADGDGLGQIIFYGADGTDIYNSTALIGALVNGTVGTDTIPTDLVFQTSVTTGSGRLERLRIASNGKILIGSSIARNIGGAAALGHLQIEGTTGNTSSVSLINNQNSSGGQPVLRFAKTRGTSDGAVTTVADGDSLGGITFTGADGTDLLNSTAQIRAIVNGTVAGNTIPTDILFETSATDGSSISEKVRITSGGNLLINHTTGRGVGNSTIRLLQVEGVGGESAITVVRNSNNTSGAGLMLGKSRSNSVGGTTIVQDDDKLGVISFAGADGVDLLPVGAQITGEVDGTPGADDMPGRLVFKTTADGASSTTERLRIDSGGRVLINADGGATGSSTTPAFQIGGDANYRLGLYNTAEAGVIANKNGDDGIQFHTKLGATDQSGIGEAMRFTPRGYRQINHRQFTYAFTNNTTINTITFGDPGDAKYNHYELLIMFRDNAYRQAIGGGRYAVDITDASGGPAVAYHLHEYYYDLGSKNGTWTFAASISSGVLQITINESSNNQGTGYIDITIIDAIGAHNGTFGTLST